MILSYMPITLVLVTKAWDEKSLRAEITIETSVNHVTGNSICNFKNPYLFNTDTAIND